MKTIHKNIFLTTLTYILSIILLQAQSHWEWATSFGSPQSESGIGLTITPQGKLLCTGQSMYESSFLADTFLLQFHSPQNAFVCKYDLNGNLLRITSGTGMPNYVGNDDEVGVAPLESLGNNSTYLSLMNIRKQVTVDTFHFYSNERLYFLSQWDTNARLTVFKPLQMSTYSLETPSIAELVISNGTIYTTGVYSDTYVDLDTIRLHNPDSLMFTSQKGFFAKIDTGGNFKLAKQAIGGKSTRFKAMSPTVNSQINFYASSDSCLVFDTMQVCKNGGVGIGALFQTDTNGNVLWTKPLYSESNGFGINYIQVDNSGNLYVFGSFNAAFHFDGDTFPKISPDWDIFMAKLSSNGTLLWFKQFYSTDGFSIYPKYNSIITQNQFYTAGTFSGSMVLCGDTITAESSRDMFVARFDTSGDCIGIVTVPNATPGMFVEDSSGNIYITGSLLDNGTAVFNETELTSNGNSDFFLAKLTAITSGAPRMLEDNLLTIYPNPNTSSFTVQVPEGFNGKRVQLGVYDNVGKTIKEERLTVEDNKLAVELGQITKGMYTVILSSGKKKYTGRVVVK